MLTLVLMAAALLAASVLIGVPDGYTQTADPNLDKLFSGHDELLVQTNPQNNKFKDQTWSPPNPSTWPELSTICFRQSTSMGVDEEIHCDALFDKCLQNELTVVECYHLYFTANTVAAPDYIQKSLDAKLKETNQNPDDRITQQK